MTAGELRQRGHQSRVTIGGLVVDAKATQGDEGARITSFTVEQHDGCRVDVAASWSHSAVDVQVGDEVLVDGFVDLAEDSQRPTVVTSGVGVVVAAAGRGAER